MKIERAIIATCAALSLAAGLYYAWTAFGLREALAEPREIRFMVPTAAGIAPGQAVFAANERNPVQVGLVKDLHPAAGGVMVTVALDDQARATEDARVIVRPSGAAKAATIEFFPGSDRMPALRLPAQVPGEIRLGSPEEMLEPAPQWPA